MWPPLLAARARGSPQGPEDFSDNSKIVSCHVEKTSKAYLYFGHGIHERFVDAQRFSTVQQALRKVRQVQLAVGCPPQ
jgi:hypothetical protein